MKNLKNTKKTRKIAGLGKILFLMGVVAVETVLSGCASAKIEKETISPLVVITVAGNSSLPWYVIKDGEEPKATKGLLQNAINSRVFENDPEIASAWNRLDYAEDALRRIFEDITEVQFVEKEAVVSSKKYKAMSEGLLSVMNTTITATDYRDLRNPGKYDLKKLLESVGGKGGVVLEFEFFKKAATGTTISGTVGPYVKMKAKLYDQGGKEIKYKTYTLQGSESLKVAGRRYDQEALVEMYPEIIDQLLAQFAMDL